MPFVLAFLAVVLALGIVQAAPVAERNLSLKNEVIRAEQKAVNWLAAQQNPEGWWSSADQPALTALAVLALQPHREEKGVAGKLARAYTFLESCVKEDGSIYVKKELVNYNTALSLLAFLHSGEARHQPIVLRARKFLIGMQSDFGEKGRVDNVFDGGIGYGSRYQHSDLSNTMHALEAIFHSRQLAADANEKQPDLNWAAPVAFIQACQNLPGYNKESWASADQGNKGGFVYFPGHSMAGETNLPSGKVALRSYGSISYAGLLSYIYADVKRDDPRVQAVHNWLQENYSLEENPGMGEQGLFFYYHTMAKALTALGVDQLDLKERGRVDWRRNLALKLLNLQSPEGFWVNKNARWWEKDPVLVTSYALLTLRRIEQQL